MLGMLILDKRHALERLVVLSARAYVPEQFLVATEDSPSQNEPLEIVGPDDFVRAEIADGFRAPWAPAPPELEPAWSRTALAA